MVLPIAVILLLGFPSACRTESGAAADGAAARVDADVLAINALLDEWVRLYNAGDFERLVSGFYAENAVLLSPIEPVREGRDAILIGYQRASLLNDEHVDSSRIKGIRVSGDLASAWGLDSGVTTPRSGSGPSPYPVQWLMTFERRPDGSWKCLFEMWGEVLPETPAKG
jgi:ketosteroid isomerase-like protein